MHFHVATSILTQAGTKMINYDTKSLLFSLIFISYIHTGMQSVFICENPDEHLRPYVPFLFFSQIDTLCQMLPMPDKCSLTNVEAKALTEVFPFFPTAPGPKGR